MSGTLYVNTRWDSEPEIFMGTVIQFREIPNGNDLPVIELQIENSFERYEVVMSQPHPELQLTEIPDSAVQLVLWTAREQYAVSRSDTAIVLETPDSLLHLPYSKLRCPDIAADIELFIAKCPVQPLADFVRRVLGRPSVGIRFLNAAMDTDGYNAPGSLARNSLEVATRSFDACRGYSDDDRWLATAAGLLHGLGRIELSDSASTDHLRIVLKTLGLLSEELKWLGESCPEEAKMIQFIIASMYRMGSHPQPHPTAIAVHSSHLLAAHLNHELMTSAKECLGGSAPGPAGQISDYQATQPSPE
ncbi:MAG: hypothetical protein ABJM11_03870 [Marinobacter sp.]|uniref:hypothetical protein n=1 Tax=Marinobacter sp. TaxID=50741 RepID=UPI00329A07B1